MVRGRLARIRNGIWTVLRRITVRDRNGTTVFLVALLFFVVTWRIGPFINDNYTVANALVAVGEGHLHLNQAVYGPSSASSQELAPTPGTHLIDGQVYGRNYGHVFLSLPFLWVISAVAAGTHLAGALTVAWSMLLVVLIADVTARFDRQREGLLVGGPLVAVLLGSNLMMTGQIAPHLHVFMSLQISTFVAAALAAVFVYRTIALMHGQHVGAAAGLGVALVTPVGFWATIPKRHSLTALFAVVTLYCFYRSRSAPTLQESTRFRALSYVPVALTTWVHAPEGFVLFLALSFVDVTTARSNAPRQLAFVATVFGVALVPFMVTNTAVTGLPVEPPRTWPSYQGTTDPGTGGTEPVSNDDVSLVGSAAILVETLVGFGVRFITYMADSVNLILDTERLFNTFVRSGNELGIRQVLGGRSLNISVLESMPIAAVLLVTPLITIRRFQASDRSYADALATVKANPKRATDLLAVGYLLLLIFMYLPRLPIKVSFTVRYLHPLYPIAVYFLARLALVRRVLDTRWRLLGMSYAGFVLVGGPLLIAAHTVLVDELEVTVQYHARLALAAGAVMLYWAVASVAFNERYSRGGAVALAFAGASTTLYVLFSAWIYFPYTDQFALPISRQIAELLAGVH